MSEKGVIEVEKSVCEICAKEVAKKNLPRHQRSIKCIKKGGGVLIPMNNNAIIQKLDEILNYIKKDVKVEDVKIKPPIKVDPPKIAPKLTPKIDDSLNQIKKDSLKIIIENCDKYTPFEKEYLYKDLKGALIENKMTNIDFTLIKKQINEPNFVNGIKDQIKEKNMTKLS